MKKKIFFAVVLICILIIIVNYGNLLLAKIFDLRPRSGLKVTAQPEAVVYINGLEVGKTPYEDDNLSAGEYLVKLISGNANWQGKIKLTKGTISNINRLLSPGIASSSGESLVLDKGKGIIITSNPSFARVEIDGKIYGLTPLSVLNLPSGEHSINLSHEGYTRRTINVTIPLESILFLNVDLSLAEIKLVSLPEPSLVATQKIRIRQTPLGYLRVREASSINSKEVGRVYLGDEFFIAEEISGWVKIKLKDDKEGYISTQYVEKLAQ